MMALYVASHYKNSPNDLQLMADAPAHHLFVLLGMFLYLDIVIFTFYWHLKRLFLTLFVGPVDELQNVLPDILCVIQVSKKCVPCPSQTLISITLVHNFLHISQNMN